MSRTQSDAKVNPGFQKGIRIGSARDGMVRMLIPVPGPQDNLRRRPKESPLTHVATCTGRKRIPITCGNTQDSRTGDWQETLRHSLSSAESVPAIPAAQPHPLGQAKNSRRRERGVPPK
jgi:hypothetical protein